MPIDYRQYPPNWLSEIRPQILARAGNQCECQGECGLHQTHPGPRRCVERHGEPAQWAKGKIVLTVAHLDHNVLNCDPENLRALCQRCHLRYDGQHHRQNAAATRRLKKGNLEMEGMT